MNDYKDRNEDIENLIKWTGPRDSDSCEAAKRVKSAIAELKARVAELDNHTERLSNRIRNDSSYFEDRMKDQLLMHSEIRGGLEATINELRKPLLDKLSLQVPPIIVKLDESPVMLGMVKADAVREAFGELADEYRSGGLRLTYTGFAIAQHIEAQTKIYADKLEAGTL